MYFFSFLYGSGFGKYYRVFKTSQNLGNSGDLVQIQDDIVLLLGEEITFPEKYDHWYPLFSAGKLSKKEKEIGFFQDELSENTLSSPSQVGPREIPFTGKKKVLIPAFFDDAFLSLLHRMVLEWFSDYKAVMKYFVPLEISELLKRNPEKEKIQKSEQNLYVFPDNRTRFNFLETHYKADKTHLQLFSTDTEKKKNEHRRMIKKGIAKHIFVTQSEIFQPYQNLKKIYFIDSYKRYYHNQQNPRYSIETVIQKMKEIYTAEVEILDFQAHF